MTTTPPPFREALRVWTRVGIQSFGGPAGQIATMHRIIVDERGWVSERRFLDALSFCNFLPGPEAQQLATYLGWSMHGLRGGLAAGGLFILPGFLVMLGLSALYVSAAEQPLVAAVLGGLKPAVVAIVVAALYRIGQRALPGRASRAIAAAAFLALFALGVPFPIVIVAAGIVGWRLGPRIVSAPEAVAVAARPAAAGSLRVAAVGLLLWWVPIAAIAAALGSRHVLAAEGFFFSQAAVVTFGGAYAVLSYVSDRVVDDFGWLAPREMIDGLALAETTPGPLILVLQFVGFVAGYRFGAPLEGWIGGLAGAAVTVWATFVPSFVFVLTLAPYLDWLRSLAPLRSALAGISAAVVGVVLNLAAWFGIEALFGEQRAVVVGPIEATIPVLGSADPVGIVVALAAGVALIRYRVSMGTVLVVAGVVGALR